VFSHSLPLTTSDLGCVSFETGPNGELRAMKRQAASIPKLTQLVGQVSDSVGQLRESPESLIQFVDLDFSRLTYLLAIGLSS
jgi:hypothetical protein